VGVRFQRGKTGAAGARTNIEANRQKNEKKEIENKKPKKRIKSRFFVLNGRKKVGLRGSWGGCVEAGGGVLKKKGTFS